MSKAEVFARVDDSGNIVEYPVYRQHIINRGHSFVWYKECVIADKPEVPKFHFLQENMVYRDSKVYISYSIIEQSLDSLLTSIKHTPVPGKPLGVRYVGDVSQEVADRIMYLADAYIENKLDKLAQSKGYKNSDRLAGYVGSTNSTFAAEAAAFVALRDKVWEDMPVYLTRILTGELPIPSSEQDIDNVLPNFNI
jgi:hypothetical protein